MPKASQLLNWSKQVPLRSIKCLFLNKTLNWYELLFCQNEDDWTCTGGEAGPFDLLLSTPWQFWLLDWILGRLAQIERSARGWRLQVAFLQNAKPWKLALSQMGTSDCSMHSEWGETKRSKIEEIIPALEELQKSSRHPLVTWKRKGVFFFGIPVRFIYRSPIEEKP